MAYASVASLLVTIDLINYHQHSSISSRFKDQITSLHQHATFLQSFFEDDPKRAENWEETIRDVTDRAEKIIDLLVSDSLLKSSMSEVDGGVDELEKVTEEMESTANRLKERGIKANGDPDEELMKIVSLLCEGSSNLETISIVGMPGMGKSILASNASYYPLVREHFDVFAWSTVGQQRRGIALELVHRITVEIVSNTGDEAAVESLYTSLTDRRYLIVLQDVWGVDAWDGVRRAFPDNGNGSRIIMTTGSLDLATSVGHVHEMSFLDEDQSWNMLREMIFEGDPCPSQLESIGKMIARSCEGHQLTIEVISGILAANQTEAVWEDVSEYINSSNSDDYVISRVTFLCYTYLPHHLRDCFLYLGCFPEDHEIRVSKLIKLWVAEGFLNQCEGKSFQETGEEHVEILVRRSLVSVSRWKSNGRIKSITFHVLLKQTCLDLARTCNFISFGAISSAEPQRRVSSSYYADEYRQGAYDSPIRTVILCSTYQGDTCFERSIGDVRLLRILDLSSAPDYDLPEQVFHLFHLRYLAFHSGFSISEAISNLQNLQTLIICSKENCRKLVELPEGIWRMPQLRHLLGFCFILPTLKQGEAENSALENLETLSRVVDFICSKENLKMIPNVKRLNVIYTESFKDVVEDIGLHNLASLHKLESLKIQMEKHNKMSFAFPPTLKKLSLNGLQLPWEDIKIVASLPNLEVLKLRKHACVGDTWETSEGGFSCLTYLMIEGLDLEHWITRSSHFPMLRTLMLGSCFHLSKVPREIGEIPTLKLMGFNGNNQTLLNSAKRIQEDRQSLGDDLLQVVLLQ